MPESPEKLPGSPTPTGHADTDATDLPSTDIRPEEAARPSYDALERSLLLVGTETDDMSLPVLINTIHIQHALMDAANQGLDDLALSLAKVLTRWLQTEKGLDVTFDEDEKFIKVKLPDSRTVEKAIWEKSKELGVRIGCNSSKLDHGCNYYRINVRP